eukprot:5346313-Amphidinium_carterae.1
MQHKLKQSTKALLYKRTAHTVVDTQAVVPTWWALGERSDSMETTKEPQTPYLRKTPQEPFPTCTGAQPGDSRQTVDKRPTCPAATIRGKGQAMKLHMNVQDMTFGFS